MSELDAFEAKVRKHIKLLSSPDAKERRKAAAWLGESGDPNAITRLKQVYEQDPDRKVREAAAYSLGMFRALQEGMAGENSDKIYDTLEDIALRGKVGRRVAVPVSILRKLAVALLVSLAILAAFNFYLWPEYEPEINTALGLSSEEVPVTGDGPLGRESLSAAIGDVVAATRSDAVQLQEQYTSVQNGGELNCEAEFNNPIVFDISRTGDHEDLAALATDLNTQIIGLVTAAKTPYNRACAADGTAPEPGELAAQQATLDNLLTALDQIEANLNEIRGAG